MLYITICKHNLLTTIKYYDILGYDHIIKYMAESYNDIKEYVYNMLYRLNYNDNEIKDILNKSIINYID